MSGQILQPVSLAAHAKYIDDKLNLIPAKFYFRTEGDENQWKITKYAQNRAGKAPKQRHKSESKRGLKISKFKEENIKSIHQQQKVCICNEIYLSVVHIYFLLRQKQLFNTYRIVTLTGTKQRWRNAHPR